MQFFFHESEKNFGSFDEQLAAACEGLVYISETDAQVVPFIGSRADKVDADTVRQQTGTDARSDVEERDVTEFFDRLTRAQEWHTDADRERTKKFLELQKLLEENLHDIHVFRFGRIQIAIYAVGLDHASRLVGISTRAVET